MGSARRQAALLHPWLQPDAPVREFKAIGVATAEVFAVAADGAEAVIRSCRRP